MLKDSEIAALERKYARWSGPSTAFVVPAVILSVFTIPLTMAFQSELHPVFYLVPVLLISGVFLGQVAASNWDDRTRKAIADHYASKYMGTRWKTAADAEGVVIEVSDFGGNLKLAFPNGIAQYYERETLVPVEP